MSGVDQQPGFRRRFRITPAHNAVQAEVEDDFHCMSVIVRHEDGMATEIVADMRRAPWTTCPGAMERLRQTFSGIPLAEFARRGEKQQNCTHLYDLAILAAAHAMDSSSLVYDILVSDPADGRRVAEIRRDGQVLLNWIEREFCIVEPDSVAGLRLDKLRPWINSLEPDRQEAARLLQWGNMLANGRTIPIEQQSDATKMPASCYTFQPERALEARRVGEIREFSQGPAKPLDDFVPEL